VHPKETRVLGVFLLRKKFCKLSNKRLDIVVYIVKVWRMFGFYTTKQANRHQRREYQE
jgi:hypothetical protein